MTTLSIIGLFVTPSIKDTKHNKSAIMLSVFFAECHNFLIVMLNVIMPGVVMPSVIMLSVVMPSVIMPNVVALLPMVI
jgi:hypothetical protein